MTEERLDVVVRFHNVARIPELERCLLSLIGQAYRPLDVHISVQRFDDAALAQVHALLEQMGGLEPDARFLLHNFTEPKPEDARSALINAGFRHATGRYLALLDYDDITTPNGYARLVADLHGSGAAISFGKVLGNKMLVDGPLLMSHARADMFKGEGLLAMFRQNFCPIHSFVLDRSKIDPQDLRFDQRMWRDEDYDFLIRTCARYTSSFRLKEYVVGYYGLKDDGSNTVMMPGEETEERWREWRKSRDMLVARRAQTHVALRVQRDLGVSPPDPDLTVEGLLAMRGLTVPA